MDKLTKHKLMVLRFEHGKYNKDLADMFGINIDKVRYYTKLDKRYDEYVKSKGIFEPDSYIHSKEEIHKRIRENLGKHTKKTTDDDVLNMLKMRHEDKMTYKEIAKVYGIQWYTVSELCKKPKYIEQYKNGVEIRNTNMSVGVSVDLNKVDRKLIQMVVSALQQGFTTREIVCCANEYEYKLNRHIVTAIKRKYKNARPDYTELREILSKENTFVQCSDDSRIRKLNKLVKDSYMLLNPMGVSGSNYIYECADVLMSCSKENIRKVLASTIANYSFWEQQAGVPRDWVNYKDEEDWW